MSNNKKIEFVDYLPDGITFDDLLNNKKKIEVPLDELIDFDSIKPVISDKDTATLNNFIKTELDAGKSMSEIKEELFKLFTDTNNINYRYHNYLSNQQIVAESKDEKKKK